MPRSGWKKFRQNKATTEFLEGVFWAFFWDGFWVKNTFLSHFWVKNDFFCHFYKTTLQIVALGVLIVSFSKDEITLFESLSMISVYISYVVFMMFNADIEAKLSNRKPEPDNSTKMNTERASSAGAAGNESIGGGGVPEMRCG